MRRKDFLDLAGRGLLFAATASAPDLLASPPAVTKMRAKRFTSRQRAALRAVADTIVPATEGMPSASEVGAHEYLEALAGREEGVARDLRGVLAALERMARDRPGPPFERLAHTQRVDLLTGMEKGDGERFRAARDLVYEAYYTQPVVWRRLGYDYIDPQRSGPSLEPFEESLLERVRALPRLYRDMP